MLDYEKAIKMRLAEKRMTYEDLEEKSGFTSWTICNLLNGKTESPEFFLVEVLLESLGLKLVIMEAD